MLERFLPLAALALAGCSTLNPPPKPQPLVGSWGGEHIGLALTLEGGTVDYDCAAGRIEGPVVPNSIGEFHVSGTHTALGGPARADAVPQSLPAIYHGSVQGEVMTLRVIVRATGQVIGPAELRRGAAPRLTRCL